MKTRGILAVLFVAVMVIPVTGALFSDDSTAAEEDFSYYYRDQLTTNQRIIYNAFSDADPSALIAHGDATYAVAVTVPSTYVLSSSSVDTLTEVLLADMARAWQATMLDNPLAWWTWSTDNAGEALFSNSFTAPGTSVAGFTFYVRIADAYAAGGSTLSERISAVTSEFNTLMSSGTISGDDDLAKIRSANKYLCSDNFVYDADYSYSGSVYGALVKNPDGKYHIACMGFSKLFKMVCDYYHIDCLATVGNAAQGETIDGHMWNTVRLTIDGQRKVLGADITFNATGPTKEDYLLDGYATLADNRAFSQTHQAFAPIVDSPALWVDFNFISPDLDKDGYTYPAESDILTKLIEFMPWILIGAICAILAFVLWSMGRRGD